MHQHHGHHHHHHGATGTILKWSLAGTVAFVVIELAAGVHAGSLALLSDAGHNFTDALALLLAVFGFYMQKKPANEVKTYGYQRAGVLAAFVNALTLLLLSAYIFWESYHRLLHPEPVQTGTMIVVAGLGLALNGAIMWGLRRDREHDLNVRAAFLHMMGDALGSVAIVVGAVAIGRTGWYAIDPVLSILIGALIVWSAFDIVRESLNILLEGLPRGIKLADVTAAMESVRGVLDVHDLHIWSLGSQTHALSCHILIDDMPPSESETIMRHIRHVLEDRFHIHHTTIQFEHVACEVGPNGCCLPAQTGGKHRH